MTSPDSYSPSPYLAEQSAAPQRPWFKKKRYWAGGIAALVIVGSALGQNKDGGTPSAAAVAASSPSTTSADASQSPSQPTSTSSAAPSVVTVTTTVQPSTSSTSADAADPTSNEPVGTESDDTPAAASAATSTETAEPVEESTSAPQAADGLSDKQQLARQAANNYLDTMPFSRLGLISQLSSEYGDGYSLADATAAVNSLTVDWNAQAVKAANNYLDTMPFSCSALTQQLSSEYGDKYTAAQAAYGAQHTKAC
ncbi:Ltp family lipoprotein [Dermacoccus nishinomiyaensis]|uniref:Ltp family lipoprotein n=1 Tax=Dermacoccus nishinomiyaensis TaxID=1274 RepID=UPI001C92BD5F|nr:Ltp family lipoprotein [Dermacoccus nishinomiyaensis]